MATIIALLLVFVLLIRLPVFQTWLCNRVSGYLSDELKAKVTVGYVNIKFFNTLTIGDLYVEDQHNDTLLFTPKLFAGISILDLKNGKLILNSVELDNARIKFQRYTQDSALSLQFIIDYFASSKKDTVASSPFEFRIENLKLNQCHFSLYDHRYKPTPNEFNFSDLDLNNLVLDLGNFHIVNDSILFITHKIAFKDKCGFEVINFTSVDSKVASDGIRMDKLVVETPSSQIKTDLIFFYTTFDDFDDFFQNINLDLKFHNSKVSFNDILYFDEDVKGLNRTINLDGDFKGTVSNFRGKNVVLAFNESTVLKGDISMKGLPNFEETFMDLKIRQLETTWADLEKIPLPPFNENNHLELPENLSYLGKIQYRGNYTGFYNDFVANGGFRTDLGNLSTDINLKLADDVDNSSYSGKLSTQQFNIGKFWSLGSTTGNASFEINIKGNGFTKEKINAKLEGLISQIVIKNYNYKNISLNGEAARKLFNGSVKVNDQNLDLDFNGTIDFRNNLPEYDFVTIIRKLKPSNLYLVNRDTTAELSTEAYMKFKGNDIDNLVGTLDLKHIQYREINNTFNVDHVSLIASNHDDKSRTIKINSEVLDADINGEYKLKSALPSLIQLLSGYVPFIEDLRKKPAVTEKIDFSVNIKKPNDILTIFYPQLQLSEGTLLTGKIQTEKNIFELKAESPQLSYLKLDFTNFESYFTTAGGKLNFNNSVDTLVINDSLRLINLDIAGSSTRQQALIDFKLANTDTSDSKVNLKTQLEFLPGKQIRISLLPSQLLIHSSNWQIDKNNSLLIDSAFTQINNLNFSADSQYVGISGKISAVRTDKADFVFRKFDLHQIQDLLKIYSVQTGGITEGNVSVASATQSPEINGDLTITDFSLFNDTLGLAKIKVDYHIAENKIVLDAGIEQNGYKNIEVKGDYLVKPKGDEMDFNIKLTKVGLQTLNHYVEGIFSDLRGLLTADLHLYGPVNEPLLVGNARVQKAGLTVDYLGTRYNLSDEFTLNDKMIKFDNVILNDEKGNQAILNGKIYHDHLRNFVYDISVSPQNCLVLKTRAQDNGLFYGTGYATGNVKIKGNDDYLSFRLALKTEKGTEINIPLTNPAEISESGFITFIDTSSANKSKTINPAAKISGIEMSFELEATNDAQIQLIFDEKIGDKIKGNGNGNLKMEITPTGEFNMYGDYTVESGDYLFTLQNVINKKFTIDRGGTIKWNGDPYDAIVDLSARYRPKVSLFDLLQDSTTKRREYVDLILKIKDRLFNPTIGFDIVVPNVDASLQNRIKSAINSEQEMNKQVISLLVLNRFSPAAGGETSNSAGISQTGAELVSQQLSGWLSQISKTFELGVNYRPGDAFNKEEYEINLSTEINDRISIGGTLGLGSQDNTKNTSGIVGDFNIDFKVTKDGKLRFKAFNKSNSNNYLSNSTSQYTQGVGVFYREEFDTFKELVNRFRDRFRKKKTESTDNKTVEH